MLHVDLPERPPETLPAVEALSDRGDACVKACYRCLLSYFNQPDHDVVDRNDLAARRALLRLAAIDTSLDTPAPASADVASADPGMADTVWVARWRDELLASGVTLPRWTLAGDAAPQWPAPYAAVVLPDTPVALKERLESAGATLFPFPSDVTRWPELFLRLSKYLGASLT